jgi:hypothetical protein
MISDRALGWRKNVNYNKTFEELEAVASKFWPVELSETEANLSVIPLLLQTQDDFIAILKFKVPSLDKLFKAIELSELPGNLFVKHLVILADFGGEMLQRVGQEFTTLFPHGKLNYLWRGQRCAYEFKVLPGRMDNKSLKIDGKELIKKHPLDDLQRDAIALLMFGSAISDGNNEIKNTLAKCEIGEYLGDSAELERYIKQRYIWVSRITMGAQSNSLGQLAQQFVATYIVNNIRVKGVRIQPGGRLPKVSHADPNTGEDTSFDLVVTNKKRYIAVEVSFQVTTNSVIERKAGQAKARYEQIQDAGHRIAYVIDGAGNFKREHAVRTICGYSHCTVAFSRSELEVLCEFLRKHLS